MSNHDPAPMNVSGLPVALIVYQLDPTVGVVPPLLVGQMVPELLCSPIQIPDVIPAGHAMGPRRSPSACREDRDDQE